MNTESSASTQMKGNTFYHILAFLTLAVWGTTFISTKLLIENGLSPHEIFFLRFLIAYIGCWLIAPKKLLANSIKDEGMLLLAGMTGGSISTHCLQP